MIKCHYKSLSGFSCIAKLTFLSLSACLIASCERTNQRNDPRISTADQDKIDSSDKYRHSLRASTTERLANYKKRLFSNAGRESVISDLYAFVRSANNDDFDELWRFLKEIPNDDGTQDSLRAETIKRLVTVTSLANAINFIGTEFGPGNLKNQLLEHAFSVAKNQPRELLAMMEGLSSAAERDAARLALEYRATKEGCFSLADFSNLSRISDNTFDVLRGAILHEFISIRNPASPSGSSNMAQEIISKIAQLNSSKTISEKQTTALIITVSENQPFALWSSLSSDSGSDFARLCEPILPSIIKNMAENSPNKTFELLKSTERLPVSVYSTAMGIWLAKDSNEASLWAKENITTMKPLAGDNVESAIVKFSVENGDLNGARINFEKIGDPELKKKAEGWIWTTERDILRQDVGKDPAGTMQSIVSGQSNYGDYWIEEAMSTWVAKDFDKAQEWYKKNWNSMPANKSQYLAAAFAKQAAGEGDVATAREWAAHIQDAKTKQRIEAGISEAEGRKTQ